MSVDDVWCKEEKLVTLGTVIGEGALPVGHSHEGLARAALEEFFQDNKKDFEENGKWKHDSYLDSFDMEDDVNGKDMLIAHFYFDKVDS